MNKKTKQLFQSLMINYPQNETELYNFFVEEEKKEIKKKKEK
jgi:mRNA-degrading endonuclease HigB of HigAB toxin-antitoxin module